MDAFNLTGPQQEVINDIPYSVLRETVRDYILNQQFRRDIYARGARRLTPLERQERLYDVAVVLTATPEEITFDADAGLGKVNLKPDIYQPIVEELADGDGGPKKIGDLAERPRLAGFGPGVLMEALAVLVGSGRAHPAQPEAAVEIATPRCRRLNTALIDRARTAGDVTCLASPVLGAGVNVGRFEQLFLGALMRGAKKPDDWAQDVWSTLAKQNQAIIKDGGVLQGADKNLEELRAQAKAFEDKRLSLLRRLYIVD
jgi:hypothetical protein